MHCRSTEKWLSKRRSASSRTRNYTMTIRMLKKLETATFRLERWRPLAPVRKWSANRPGVAMMIWGRLLSATVCGIYFIIIEYIENIPQRRDHRTWSIPPMTTQHFRFKATPRMKTKKTQSERGFKENEQKSHLPIAVNCSAICMANSRAGVNIIPKIPNGSRERISNMGNANAAVLPLPVSARPITSDPTLKFQPSV